MLLDKIMTTMGFSPEDQGPMVTRLREVVEHQIKYEGLTYRSHGTWADGILTKEGWTINAEERARAILEMEWAMYHGAAYEVKCPDGFEWKYARQWLGDGLRLLGMKWRQLWMERNPYAKK